MTLKRLALGNHFHARAHSPQEKGLLVMPGLERQVGNVKMEGASGVGDRDRQAPWDTSSQQTLAVAAGREQGTDPLPFTQ